MSNKKDFNEAEVLKTLEEAYQYSLEIERHARQESGQSQLSPTDMAFFSRLITYLRYDLPKQLTGDPNYLIDRRENNNEYYY